MRVGAIIAALVLVGGAGAAVYFWPPRRAPAAPPAKTAAETTELVRQDLTTSQSMPGTLGFGAARPVIGAGAGIVTWMPQPGAVVRRGHQLYRVDDHPVPLFYGTMPLYRPVKDKKTVGRDVRVVADNLRALGYRTGPLEVDEAGATTLTESLIAAVKRWQGDLGLPQTGAITPADVVVQRGAVRVDSVAVQPGVAAAAPLMSVTETTKVITVEAEADQAAGIDRGDKVGVEVPGGGTVPGKVKAVGTELKTSTDTDQAPKLAITVALDDPKKMARFDAGDVDVVFAGQTRKHVLVAPVAALTALSEGGYALQVDGGSLVPVRTGMFAKGLVEVKGGGLAEGVRVVTAG